jgi:hypothetical protein
MVCNMFLRSEWSIVRSALFAKGGTLKKRLSPHLHKVLTRGNKVSPQTLQIALLDATQNKDIKHEVQQLEMEVLRETMSNSENKKTSGIDTVNTEWYIATAILIYKKCDWNDCDNCWK